MTVAAGKSVCTDDFADPSSASIAAASTSTTTSTDSVASTSTANTGTARARTKREHSSSSDSLHESDSNSDTDADSDSDVPLAELAASLSSSSESDQSTDVEPDANNNSQPDLSEIPGLSGIKKCQESDLKVGDWVVVDFSADKKQKLYLGRIESLTKSAFEGIFMRNSSSTDGSVFTFPVNEDRCTFDFKSVKGIVDPPAPMRRGAWKFQAVNAKQW